MPNASQRMEKTEAGAVCNFACRSKSTSRRQFDHSREGKQPKETRAAGWAISSQHDPSVTLESRCGCCPTTNLLVGRARARERTMRHRGGGGCSTTYRWQGEDNRCIVAMATYKSNSQDIGMSLRQCQSGHFFTPNCSIILDAARKKESGADIGPNTRRS